MNSFKNEKLLIPSPLQEVEFYYRGKVCRLFVKRDDLIHFFIGGNKWRKLMGHPIFKEQKKRVRVLSTGGNYSNLVFALCWICHLYNYPLTILSPETAEDTYLMEWAKKLGVEFIGLSRTQLRAVRNDKQSPFDYITENKDVIWIPEGGSGPWSEEGISLMIKEIEDLLHCENVTLLAAAGTGISSFYMLKNLPMDWQLQVFPSIKSNAFNHFLEEELGKCQGKLAQWRLISQNGDKGIGNISDDLLDFLVTVYDHSGVLLDPFYNGKALYYFYKNKGLEGQSHQVVLIHSGGNQAWYGLSLKYPSDKRIKYLAEVVKTEFERFS
ncbi:MAG: pyridoxal-phosphate dependent enzyme [Saprospirales bacterium]|nr:MAG: pyridoxal-phosphate dependent enzyme [Saprospirales bacterium]